MHYSYGCEATFKFCHGLKGRVAQFQTRCDSNARYMCKESVEDAKWSSYMRSITKDAEKLFCTSRKYELLVTCWDIVGQCRTTMCRMDKVPNVKGDLRLSILLPFNMTGVIKYFLELYMVQKCFPTPLVLDRIYEFHMISGVRWIPSRYLDFNLSSWLEKTKSLFVDNETLVDWYLILDYITGYFLSCVCKVRR